MATSGIAKRSHHSPSNAPRIAAIIALGVLGGVVITYATAIVGGAQLPGGSTTSPIVLLLLAALVAMAVASGWRWPLIGLAAGATMALIIMFAVLQHISLSSASHWLDPLQSVGYGAVSGYPAMIAAVILSASILRLYSNRKHE